MWTRLPMAAGLLLFLLAPIAPEAGEGDPCTRSVEAWIAQLGDDGAATRETATAALAELGEPAVPALLAAVQTGTGRTRRGAAEALRRIGPRAVQAAPALLRALRDKDEDLAAAAARALGGIGRGDPSMTTTLLDAVHTWDDFQFAAQALVGMGRTGVPAIVDALVRGDRPFRLRILHSVLGQMREEAMDAIPALILLRQGDDVAVAQSAQEVLHGSHPDKEQVIAALIASLESAKWEIRLLCVQQLAGHGPDAHMALGALAKRLKEDEDPIIRRAAAQALSFVAPTDAATVRALGDALGDDDAQTVSMAICALGAIGHASPEAASALQLRLGRPDPVGSAVGEALVQCGMNAVPALMHGLGGTDETVRLRAATALGEIGPPAADAVPGLVRALRDTSEAVQAAAGEALGKLGAAAVPQLLEILESKEIPLRISAATALGEIGEDAAEAVPALGKALKEREVELRRAAAAALGHIGKPAAPFADELAKALRDRDAGMRATAATALGGLCADGKPGVKALAKAVREKDKAVAIAAVDALGQIGPDAGAATRSLLWCLRNAPTEVKWRATRTLGLLRLREKRVVKALADALLCSDWRVRRHAAVALGALGTYAAGARKDLEKLATDGRAEVREAASAAIERIEGE